MAQKTDAEASAFVSAFDQTRQIGDHESAADVVAFFACAAARRLRHTVCTNHAEIRFERGERIIRNFGPRSGNYRNQCGLARVGIANKADIGKQFQFEPQAPLLTRLAIFVFARSLVPRLCEILITAAAAATVRD